MRRGDRREERRIMLEAIIDDPGASHSDRLRADEALRDLEREDAAINRADSARLSRDEVVDELRSLRDMTEAALAIAAGPDEVEPPDSGRDEILRLRVEDAVEVRDRALADLDHLRETVRAGFAELLGDEEPDVEAVLAAWRAVRAEPQDADVVVDALPDGENG